MNGYTPDAIVPLLTSEGPIVVFLAKGGDQFPWAVHNGKVYVGLFQGVLEEGVTADQLSWNVNEYWVVEAFDQNGGCVELTPEQYQEAVTQVGVRKTLPFEEGGFCSVLWG